ncbi:hypothetical protein [Shewanella woodyi]|uniref:Uncharacterized protein n=1 Tax=Shewanella woodyi (strain ATCC 51908 / MS32) TaxID=392500 RepID=B1KQ54_SHEWM|nr:hypothetical protein [Shewanella woodyi]ACA89167.1 hypothetical protein Swoo_4918 [Shewanella woodyi ATCC 51908]
MLINLSEKFEYLNKVMQSVSFSDVRLSQEFNFAYENFIKTNKAGGYTAVEWAEYSTKITTSTDKSIYLSNFWFYIAYELSEFLEGLNNHQKLFSNIFTGENLQEIAKALRGGSRDFDKQIESYFYAQNLSQDDLELFRNFTSNYPSWGGGKTIDREDFFISPILKAGNLLAETQVAIAEIAKQFSESESLKSVFACEKVATYTGNKSEGGNILSESSRSEFVFKLLSLLVKRGHHGKIFSSLVDKNNEHGSYNLEDGVYRLTSFFKASKVKLETEDLKTGGKLRFFESPFFVNDLYYYLSNQWTDGTESRLDIQSLMPLFNNLYNDYQILLKEGRYILIFNGTSSFTALSKPFLLLAGISGTGKTRFVREQVKASGSLSETYCLTSVRPDWHEPSDLLGYVSRLNKKVEYVSTDVIEFIAKSWRAIIDSDLVVKEQTDEKTGDIKLVVQGDSGSLNAILPYWLCLDEMNLAPVEQYFADYLSVIETREWQWTEDDFTYACDALLSATTISHPDYTDSLRKQLGFEGDNYDNAWLLFKKYGIGIPFNLIVAGTVNMDETTHGFSRKVIDRALSFDFGEFFPNDIDDFFESKKIAKPLSYPVYSHAKLELFKAVEADSDAKKSTLFFKAVNEVLKGTAFELAFRAFNELCLSVISFAPKTDHELQAVFDDFLMCKVLPRIEGDEDKLASRNEGNLLEQLALVLESELKDIWQNQRPDLYRAFNDSADEKVLETGCRSYKKIETMTAQLTSGFTSFWP